MRLRWLKYETGSVDDTITIPGLIWDTEVPSRRKFIKTPTLQYSLDDGATWLNVEDGPTIPFEQWKNECS